MKTLVVCDSRAYGNTRRVAEALAAVLDADVAAPHAVRPDEIAGYDLVGFGSGIYAMNFYRDLLELVAALPKVEGKRAFVFLTSASSERRLRKPVGKLAATLAERGYEVVGHFWCRGYWEPLWLRPIGGVNKGRPNQSDLAAAQHFARRLTAPSVVPEAVATAVGATRLP
jgi:flavodoxin